MRTVWVILFACSFYLLSCNSSDRPINNIPKITQKSDTSIALDTLTVKEYYPDGKLKSRGLVFENKKMGLWCSYDELGQLVNAYHYYYDTLKFEIDKSELQFEILDIPLCRMKISIPNNFIDEPGASSQILFSKIKKCNDKTGNCPSLVLTYFDTVVSIDETRILEVLEKRFDRFKMLEATPIKIGDRAMKTTFICRKNELKIGGVVIVFNKGKRTYSLTYLGPNNKNGEFLPQKDVIDEIINSITFY